ncbi:hypothetical protein BC835DRAFT_1413531 [Cytidiella melzeri]|nr:hypothetical protein BC835DRAFT_1413531 [Cytidiella melzeri]
MEDPLQWPQVYSPQSKHNWLHCMPRSNHPRHQPQVWASLKDKDLQLFEGILCILYVVKPSCLEPIRASLDELSAEVDTLEQQKGYSQNLHWIQLSAEHVYACLSLAATKRDLILQFVATERKYCMAVAWMTWDHLAATIPLPNAAPVLHNDLMGCFTTDAAIAQRCFHIGIPVWYLRITNCLTARDIIVSRVGVQQPTGIVPTTGVYSDFPLYTGSPGPAQLDAICFGSMEYINAEAVPYPTEYGCTPSESDNAKPGPTASSACQQQAGPSRAMSTTPSRTIPSASVRMEPYCQPVQHKDGGRLKFEDKLSPRIPPLLSAWEDALVNLDTSRMVTPPSGSWGFWVPEPALVVGPANPDRVRRYMLNWLSVCEPWYYVTRTIRHCRAMVVQWWRAYLDDGLNPSASPQASKARNLSKVLDTLAEIFDKNNINSEDLKPMWLGQPVISVDDNLCRDVVWELPEIGFRMDLFMLDRALHQRDCDQAVSAAERVQLLNQVFSGGNILHVDSIPSSDIGLASPNLVERGKCLEEL